MKFELDDGSTLVMRSGSKIGPLIGLICLIAAIIFIPVDLLVLKRGLWLFALIVIPLSALIVWIALQTELRIDRLAGKIRISRSRLIVPATTIEYGWDDLAELILDQRFVNRRVNGESQERPIYNLIFAMRNGYQEAIDVTPAASTIINGINVARFQVHNKIAEGAERIAAVLGVKVVHRRPPTFGEAVDIVQRVIGEAKNNRQG